jgi:hypothetical protein
MNRALWIVQGLLSALFLFGGVAKLMMPLDEMVEMTGLPGAFLVFISVAEILGSIGLIVPSVTRIRPGLTPLAAAGLVVIMIGATVLTAMGVGGSDPVSALFPLVVGLLAAFVAYGRWRLVPQRRTARAAVLQAA